MQQPLVIIIMGVSGSGKTTIGSALARQLGWQFHDADDDHSPENVQQMRSGRALTESQRLRWLELLARRIQQWLAECRPTVLACSALTREARRKLNTENAHVQLVYLRGSRELIRRRMRDRDHFMPPLLLDSQLQMIEEPTPEEAAITIDPADAPDVIVRRIRSKLEPHMDKLG